MIPSQILSSYALLRASVVAARPLSTVSPLRLSALVDAGNSLATAIDAARDGIGPVLDGSDPTGFPGAFPQALAVLADTTLDQATLDDLRGSVGRITFNLSVGQGAPTPPLASPPSGAIGLFQIGVSGIGAP